jgi:membrane protein YdbS with pleckstrin-like domain
VARYKVIKDLDTVGDERLINQEAGNIRNVQNIMFFFIIIIFLCMGIGIASYISFIMNSSAATAVFLILLLAIPLDMFVFRMLF